MKIVALALLAAGLAGCVSQVTLVSDTKEYVMKVDQLAGRLSVDIDGNVFTGRAVGSDQVAFGTSQSFGMRPTTTTSTIIVPGANGQAVLSGSQGGFLQCSYAKNGMTVVGRCQSNTGQQYALLTK